MASASKTPNLNLPQWLETEKPERTDFNAAFDAIDDHVSTFAKSLTLNGYQKYPSGLIEQWGSTTFPANSGGANIQLPIAFPNGVLNIQATVTYISGGGSAQLKAAASGQFVGNSNIYIYVRFPELVTPNVAIGVHWRVLGY